MDAPKKPEIPTYSRQHGERQGDNRAVLCWSIQCAECGHVQGTTNYTGARDSALKRLADQGKKCPACGASSWCAKAQSD